MLAAEEADILRWQFKKTFIIYSWQTFELISSLFKFIIDGRAIQTNCCDEQSWNIKWWQSVKQRQDAGFEAEVWRVGVQAECVLEKIFKIYQVDLLAKAPLKIAFFLKFQYCMFSEQSSLYGLQPSGMYSICSSFSRISTRAQLYRLIAGQQKHWWILFQRAIGRPFFIIIISHPSHCFSIFWYLSGGEKLQQMPMVSYSSKPSPPRKALEAKMNWPVVLLQPTLASWPREIVLEQPRGQIPTLRDGGCFILVFISLKWLRMSFSSRQYLPSTKGLLKQKVVWPKQPSIWFPQITLMMSNFSRISASLNSFCSPSGSYSTEGPTAPSSSFLEDSCMGSPVSSFFICFLNWRRYFFLGTVRVNFWSDRLMMSCSTPASLRKSISLLVLQSLSIINLIRQMQLQGVEIPYCILHKLGEILAQVRQTSYRV